ncbi:sigma-70 family RNA polymerase sigma factor [Bacillus sp. BGMRC 2118]|nr:sigma-70 family RNA polymerase sigma factor [Bacillus sp. BGMRC 2118]
MKDSTLSKMSEEKIREYMQEYGSGLLKLIYSYVKNWDTAEDLVQETFITVFCKFDLFDHKSSVKTWIYRIAINKCKDYLKSPKNRLLHYYSFIQIPKGESITDKLIENEVSVIISECILKLSVKYREVLLFYYYEEMSVKEISDLLNVTEGTIKTRLLRGREKFKSQYEKRVREDAGSIKEFKDGIG